MSDASNISPLPTTPNPVTASPRGASDIDTAIEHGLGAVPDDVLRAIIKGCAGRQDGQLNKFEQAIIAATLPHICQELLARRQIAACGGRNAQ